MNLTLAAAARAMGGRVVAGDPGTRLGSYATDHRQAGPGTLFFALRGASRDGHEFAAAASAAGAAVVVDRDTEAGLAIQVDDPWRALYALARHALDAVRPLVVGVTGSNGKTSTKEMVAAVLSARHSVLRTEGNLNTETGVPLTILRLEPGHTALVLEMGMQGPGEIARLAALARPAIGIVTLIGTVHMEFFASRDDLARAKGELVAGLPPTGLAVLNADDRYTPLLAGLTPARVVTFGLTGGDVRGEDYRSGSMTVDGVRVEVPVPGAHQARNALAALAAGREAGVSIEEGAAALRTVTLAGRLAELHGPAGLVIVDDSYNASPESMLAAFEALAERPRAGRMLALLGEMRELGELSLAEHRRVGAAAGALFDEIAVVASGHGPEMAAAAGARLLPDLDAAERWVRERAGADALVLVKASNGVRLHEVVRRLAAQ